MSTANRDYRGQIAALTPPQRRALRHALESRSALTRPAEPRLVVYWSASSSAQTSLESPGVKSAPSVDELRTFLATRLPDYMLPHAFEQLPVLPRLPGGKVDTRALPKPAAPPASPAFCLPRTPTEEILTRIWQDALGVERISVFDNFFEIGGDSLVSIRVLARARREDLVIPTDQFFDTPTIAALATLLDGGHATGPTRVADQASDVSRDATPLRIAPLTPIQHWFFECVTQHQHHWNQSVLLDVPPDVDENALNKVVRALLSRHDALRLRITPDAESSRQEFPSTVEPLPVRAVRLATKESGTKHVASVTAVADELHSAFVLKDGRLVSFTLCETAPPGTRQLLIIAHHLVIDAVSWSLLLEELDLLLRRSSRTPSARPALPMTTAS